jgi:hypothetical protein
VAIRFSYHFMILFLSVMTTTQLLCVISDLSLNVAPHLCNLTLRSPSLNQSSTIPTVSRLSIRF